MPVFCSQCRHYRIIFDFVRDCRHPDNYIQKMDYEGIKTIREKNCNERNANNDCPLFESITGSHWQTKIRQYI